MAAEGPEKIIFVGGAPRSGTTVTHALICTSHQVNTHSPEIAFFRAMPDAFRIGMLAWELHTHAFFDSEEAFRLHMRETADFQIRRFWDKLGRPKVLAVKDPLLTPYFPEVAALYPDKALFVTVIRHPYDVVRSRQEVQIRAGAEFGAEHARVVAEDYVSYYEPLVSGTFRGRQFAFRYEGLNKPEVQASLATFLEIDDLHARPIWGRHQDMSENAWHSPKYFQPIDMEPRLSPLADEFKAVVRAICGPLMRRFGYGERSLAA